MTPEEIDRFRGWSLAALYASMPLLCLLLVLATFKIWPLVADSSLSVGLLVLSGAVTVVLSGRTAFTIVRALRAGGKAPQLALSPFLFMALTLYAASELFTGL